MSEQGQAVWDELVSAKDEIINNHALVDIWFMRDIHGIAETFDETLTEEQANTVMLMLHVWVDPENPISFGVIKSCIKQSLFKDRDPEGYEKHSKKLLSE
jgi:hypothetical protein